MLFKPKQAPDHRTEVWVDVADNRCLLMVDGFAVATLTHEGELVRCHLMPERERAAEGIGIKIQHLPDGNAVIACK